MGNALGYVMPLWILDIFPGNQETGWQTIGVIIALFCLGSWLASFSLTKKNSVVGEKKEKKKGNVIRDILENYFQLCKLRTMRLLIIYKTAFSCAFAVFNIGTIYYLQYSLGLDNRYSSYMYLLTIVVFILMTPLANKMALTMGKANQQMTKMCIRDSFHHPSGIGILCRDCGDADHQVKILRQYDQSAWVSDFCADRRAVCAGRPGAEQHLVSDGLHQHRAGIRQCADHPLRRKVRLQGAEELRRIRRTPVCVR